MNYYYQREFSKEKLNNIIVSESSTYEVLTESNIIQKYMEFLMELGLNYGNFVNECSSCATKISSIIREKGLNSESEKEIISIFERTIEKVGEIFLDPNKIKDKANKLNAGFEKIKASYKVLILVIFVNTTVDLVLSLLFGRLIGRSLTAIIVAPIVEEISKSIAIKGGFVQEYTLVFNVHELSNYVKLYGKVVGFAKMITIRLKCVLLHLTTTILQWLTVNKDILKKCGVNPDDTDTVNFIGRIIAIFIHTTWNFLAAFSPAFGKFLAGD